MRRVRQPPLYPWHVRALRLLVDRGPMSAVELGRRLYAATPVSVQGAVALHELLELHDRRLVDRDHGRPERWHPALFAAEAMRGYSA